MVSSRLRLQQVTLSCIKDQRLLGVAAQDLSELRRLDPTANPKSFVLLLGSISEAALLDYLVRNKPKAMAAALGLSKPVKAPLLSWRFYTMIELAKGLKALVSRPTQ